MVKVQLYENDIREVQIEEDVKYFDEDYLEEIPKALLDRYKANREEWKLIQKQLRDIKGH